jgi:hypothetical protein
MIYFRIFQAKYINDSLSLIRDMKTCQNFEEVLIARSQNVSKQDCKHK